MTSTIQTTIRTLSPLELRAQLEAGGEHVLVDVSEGYDYEDGHITVSVPAQASEVDLVLPRIAPRRSVPVIVTSTTGGALAERAARRLAEIGYGDVSVLDGGNAAWAGAGYVLVTQFNSLSKALGEFVERRYHTPKVTPEELKRKLDAGEDVVILDSRPFAEYEAVSIPGGIDAPGAELVRRAYDAVERPETQVVVNCAGRTRAIIGAQALINAGFPNPVASLENGTTGWQLSGFEPAHGATDVAPEPSADGLAQARRAAAALAERFAITTIGRDTLAAFAAQAEQTTLYVFDVRTPEEFERGHLPEARLAPGGQLVQTTDYYVGSRAGRVVLVDDASGVRAAISASWLIQLGLPHVYVYRLDGTEALAGGPEDAVEDLPGVTYLDPEELAADRESTLVVDLAPARRYVPVRHHIPGSYLARRSTLDATLPKAGVGDRTIVFTSDDGALAALAAREQAGAYRTAALRGGTQAWRDAGLATVTGSPQLVIDPAEAIPAEPTLEERRASYQGYVDWGDAIVGELERDGLVEFVEAGPR